MSLLTSLPQSLILLGAGGHARVVLGLIRQLELRPLGVCDPVLHSNQVRTWEDLAVLGDDRHLLSINKENTGLVLGIGQLIGDTVRHNLFQTLSAQGFLFPNLVHPRAFVDPSSTMGSGVQIMAGAILQPGVQVGHNVIVNTSASIDHDCKIGSHVHIAPGATLCGGVEVEDHVFIGAGSVIVQNTRITKGSVIKAGSLVKKGLQ